MSSSSVVIDASTAIWIVLEGPLTKPAGIALGWLDSLWRAGMRSTLVVERSDLGHSQSLHA